MDFDNLIAGFDPKSKTGLDPEGKWAPGVQVSEQVSNESKSDVAPLPEVNAQEVTDPKVTADEIVDEVLVLYNGGTLNYAKSLVLLGNKCVGDITFTEILNKFNSAIGVSEETANFIEEVVAEASKSKKEIEPEVKLKSGEKYPLGEIVYPSQPGQEKLRLNDPKPEYPFEDFELTVTRIYDDGKKEEVNNMILGFRGSIKGYVKVYEDDTFENYLYGFKQVIKNRKDRKPLINISVKYHNSKGELITPVFGKLGDEKISKDHVNYQLI